MVFIIKKRGKLILLLAVLFITGLLIKRGYDLNNKIISTTSQAKAYIAIIIDDFGYNGEGTSEMLSLDVPFTAAVMPFLETSAQEAQKVHDANKDVIVHMAMDSHTGKKSWLGDRYITTDLTDEEVSEIINDALNELKWAVGINNHMGSKITEDSRIMKDILTLTNQKDLVFIDSMTTPDSVTSKISKEVGAKAFFRDVFLDSTDDQSKVEKNLIELGNIALKKGYAVGIGHVGPEGGKITAAAIKKIAPQLQSQNISFVTISDLNKLIN